MDANPMRRASELLTKNVIEMEKTLILAVVILLIGCQKEDIPYASPSLFGFSSIEEAREHLGEYANFFDPEPVGVLGFQIDKSPSGHIESGYQAILVDESIAPSAKGTYYIEDLEFAPREAINDFGGTYITNCPEGYDHVNAKCQCDFTEIAPYLGREVNFQYKEGGQTVFSQAVYMPRDLNAHIHGQSQASGSNTYYAVDRNSFHISWNEDSQNVNGIVMVIIYQGMQVSENQLDPANRSEIKIRATRLDDTGEITLSRDVFDWLPENAYCEIQFIRGAMPVVEGQNDKKYRIEMRCTQGFNVIVK